MSLLFFTRSRKYIISLLYEVTLIFLKKKIHVQNIEQGKRYKVVYHVKSERKFDFQLSFTGVDVIKVASSRR